MNQKLNKPRFLILTALTIPYTAGGGHHAFSFARYLACQGHIVRILSYNPGSRHPKREIVDDVNIFRLTTHDSSILGRWFIYLSHIPRIIRNIQATDLIFIYGKYFIFFRLAILIGWILNKKVIFRSTILEEDDIHALVSGNNINSRLNKFVFKHLSLYFSINPEFTRHYLSQFHTPVKVFESPQGVDISIFHPMLDVKISELRNKFKLSGNIFTMVSVGSLIIRKGYKEIIDSLSQIQEPFCYIVLTEIQLINSPHLKQKQNEIHEIINLGQEKLGNKIRFIDNSDFVAEILNVADAFVMNSYQEGLPNSLLEALACRTSPIVRHLPGVSEYIAVNGVNAHVFKDMNEFISIVRGYIGKTMPALNFNSPESKLIEEKISFKSVYSKFTDRIFIER